MSYNKTLFGNTVSVPESGNSNVGAAATAILDDLIDGVDQSFTMISGVVVPVRASTTTSLSAAGTLTQSQVVHRVSGNGAAVTLSGTTAIANGTSNGQILVLVGDHATNTVTIQNGANVQMRGDVTLKQFDTITFAWNSTQADWIEISRSGSHRFQNQNALEFYEAVANGQNKISVIAPASLAGDLTWTLPNVNASGFLQNNGSGTLTWGTASGTTLDAAYIGGKTITSNAGAITITTSTNNQALICNKTAAGTGNVIEIDNDGTGNGLLVNQDGAAEAATFNRPTGGLVVRVRSATSGDPYLSVDSNSAREARLGVIDAGNVFVGSGSNHSLELRTNNTARMTFDTTGLAAIGGAIVSGVNLGVYSSSSTTETRITGSTGEGLKLIMVTGTLSGFTGATMTAAGVIPAGAQVVMITFRIQTTITGAATSFDCGVSGALTRYLSGITSGANYNAGSQYRSTINGAQTTTNSYASNTDLVFTANGSNFSAGAVKYSISYFGPQAPTS